MEGNEFLLRYGTAHTLSIECLAGSNHHICSFPEIFLFCKNRVISDTDAQLKDISATM
jgi:hypothetical protein